MGTKWTCFPASPWSKNEADLRKGVHCLLGTAAGEKKQTNKQASENDFFYEKATGSTLIVRVEKCWREWWLRLQMEQRINVFHFYQTYPDNELRH